jgi:xanthine dehydrogenase accessory factor
VTEIERFLQRLSSFDAVFVTVQSHRGSVPRETGAWMAVFADTQMGTVGGGHLEWQAVSEAKTRLASGLGAGVVRYALGASLGQCCGGEVHLQFESVSASDVSRLQQFFTNQQAGFPQVALFGGGHVGAALVHVLGTLPLNVRWIDSRDEVFPNDLPSNVSCEHSLPVHGAVNELSPQSHVLIMSFSHAEDLDVVAACLQRQRSCADMAFIGLIGSRSKWLNFRRQLVARGFGEQELALVTCPIGIQGVAGKEPAVIAVAVAAQLLLSFNVSDLKSADATKET